LEHLFLLPIHHLYNKKWIECWDRSSHVLGIYQNLSADNNGDGVGEENDDNDNNDNNSSHNH
jgi:hypothetical protein